jgi:D-glycero-D-manno-heptose 1,7-bisphosphate phosphatase
MKVIFLDRDGVINRYPGHRNYLTRLKDFAFVPGALAALKELTQAGFKIFVISNQAGVSKGIYSKEKLKAITALMLKRVSASGARIVRVFYCIHREEEGCPCRKPKIGLVRKALKGLRLDSRASTYFVGDSILDVQTGKNAGFKTILVLSGKENTGSRRLWQVKPDFVAKDLLAATKIVLDENSSHPRFGRSRT